VRFFVYFCHKIARFTNYLILFQYCTKYGEIWVFSGRANLYFMVNNHSQAVGAQAQAHPTGRLANHFPNI